MQTQIETMLGLQHEMNVKVHPQWFEQHFEWYRAIWVESAELMDHYGWKWWKKQTPNMAQVKLEIIDIWHFGLSMLLEQNISAATISATLEKTLNTMKSSEDLLKCTEAFAGSTLTSRKFDLAGFINIMMAADMSFDELYCGYIGKNVLNFFRQDHGYKEGTYKKTWQNREDNEHLTELMDTLNSKADNFKDDLYQALKARYEQIHA